MVTTLCVNWSPHLWTGISKFLFVSCHGSVVPTLPLLLYSYVKSKTWWGITSGSPLWKPIFSINIIQNFNLRPCNERFTPVKKNTNTLAIGLLYMQHNFAILKEFMLFCRNIRRRATARATPEMCIIICITLLHTARFLCNRSEQ